MNVHIKYQFRYTKGSRFILTLIAVFLCHLSLPGNCLPIFAWICLVPLGLAINGATLAQSTIYSFIFGLLGWVSSTKGLASGLSSYVHLSVPEVVFFMIAFCAFLAIPYGLFGLFYGFFQWIKYPLGPFKTASCLTILLSFIPTPVPVTPAHSLYVFPIFTQILDLGGEPLILFVLFLVNWLFVDLILRIQKHQNFKPNLVSILLLFAFITIYGHVRLNQFHQKEAHGDQKRMITIASIQPNIPLPGRSDSLFDDTDDPLDILLEMSKQVLTDNPLIELVVWPETPRDINCAENSENYGRLVEFAKHYDSSFLINCKKEDANSGIYNTALMISGDGNSFSYSKQKLFPFAEYIPGERQFPLLRKIVPGASRYMQGEDTIVFSIKKGWFVFTAICYEVLFADHVKKFIKKGGNILINPVNDAWFGESRIPDFLISAGVYQAIRYRVPLIRVSNSGSSLYVKASGELDINSKTPNFLRKTTVCRVYVPRDRSLYTNFGNIFLYVLTLSWIINIMWDINKRRKWR